MDTIQYTVTTQPIFQVGHPEWASNLIDAIKRDQQYADRDVTLLAEHAIEAKEGKIWSVVFEDEPKTWERFCSERVGLPVEYIDAIIIGVDVLKGMGYEGEISEDLAQNVAKRGHIAKRAEQATPLNGPGRPIGDNQLINSDNYQNFGTSANYLSRRIARDHPDVLERMIAGEFRSVRQAAIEAGIVKPERRISIPIHPARAARSICNHFSPEQVSELIVLLAGEKAKENVP